MLLEDLAAKLLIGSNKKKKELEQHIKDQWQYRKNKDIRDVQSAIRKGLKNGNYKTEQEIGFIALYLNDVFKKVR